MKFAKPEDLEQIYKIFNKYRSIFPLLRKTEIAKSIDKKLCIFQNGIIIKFKKYKVKTTLGNCKTSKGDYKIEYLATDKLGSGKAFEVVDEFCKYVKADIWLCVRKHNDRAVAFYRKFGFIEMSPISWANGKIPGLVFKLMKVK